MCIDSLKKYILLTEVFIMTKDFFDVVNERTSIREYDSSAKLSKEELTELLEATVKSPSAWNLQHWHFVVITDQDAKERLLPIAYNQKQITEAIGSRRSFASWSVITTKCQCCKFQADGDFTVASKSSVNSSLLNLAEESYSRIDVRSFTTSKKSFVIIKTSVKSMYFFSESMHIL